MLELRLCTIGFAFVCVYMGEYCFLEFNLICLLYRERKPLYQFNVS